MAIQEFVALFAVATAMTFSAGRNTTVLFWLAVIATVFAGKRMPVHMLSPSRRVA